MQNLLKQLIAGYPESKDKRLWSPKRKGLPRRSDPTFAVQVSLSAQKSLPVVYFLNFRFIVQNWFAMIMPEAGIVPEKNRGTLPRCAAAEVRSRMSESGKEKIEDVRCPLLTPAANMCSRSTKSWIQVRQSQPIFRQCKPCIVDPFKVPVRVNTVCFPLRSFLLRLVPYVSSFNSEWNGQITIF
jgi:hypothetical protein